MHPTSSPTVRLDVPAGSGRAVRLDAGQRLTIIDVDGAQVADVFAFVADDVAEHLSASHTRLSVGRLFPGVGEAFATTRRRPILTLVADTSPGVHDMLIAACDEERYRALGRPGHASCAANLNRALRDVGTATDVIPQPVNVFMNVQLRPDGALRLRPARSEPGDTVTLRAELDCVVVVSACPMDVNGINGTRPSGLVLTTSPAIDTPAI